MNTVAPRPKSEESATAHDFSVPSNQVPPSSGRFGGRTPSEGVLGDEPSPTGHAPRAERQSINYCPYCSEEDLFPLEGGGWECRSCRRAFAVTFKGLVAPGHRGGVLDEQRGTTPLDPRKTQS